MKKFFTLLMTIITLTVSANPISQNEALRIANQFLTKKHANKVAGYRTATAQQPELTYQDIGMDHLYTFVEKDGGFVVMAADDRVEPVLAYSTSEVFNANNMPEVLQLMLLGYEQQIASLPDSYTGRKTPASQREKILPLIKTLWHQGLPFSYYCPFDADMGMNTKVGCTATALCQLMRYWEYPSETTISIPSYTTYTNFTLPELPPTTFNYDKMRINYSYLSDPADVDITEEAVEQVAKLSLYAGCALGVNYSCYGSSAVFEIDSIAKYFNYDKECRCLSAGNYPFDTWEEMVYNELKAGRPVPYAAGAFGAQNHIFIIDGYDGNGYFHANIGDTGHGNDNVFYKLGVINTLDIQTAPLSVSGYNIYQMAWFGFQPDKGNDALPKAYVTYNSYDLEQYDFTRSSDNADFEGVRLKATLKRTDGNGHAIDCGWGLFRNGVLKKELCWITTEEMEKDLDMTFNFGKQVEEGSYQLFPIFRMHGATEWEWCTGLGDTDDHGIPLRHYVATIQPTSLHIGLSDLDPHVSVTKVDYYTPYAGEKLNVRAYVANQGENFYNLLFLYIDGELKSGLGMYVNPGQSGTVDFCVAAPTEGTHELKITTDFDGQNAIFSDQLTITQIPEVILEGSTVLEGIGNDGIVENEVRVTCTITNVGNTTFNNMVHAQVNAFKLDENNMFVYDFENGINAFPWRRIYYLKLEPGESTTISFSVGRETMRTGANNYEISIYYHTANPGMEPLYISPFIKFAEDEPSGITVSTTEQDRDKAYYDLQGRQIRTGNIKPGIYIHKDRKLLVK